MPERRSRGETLESVADAAARTGVSRQTFYRLLNSGEVESLHIGRSRRVVSSSLDAYIRRQVGGLAQGPAPEVAEAAALLVSRTCEGQGLDVQILDPDVLAQVAGLLRNCTRHPGLEAAS